MRVCVPACVHACINIFKHEYLRDQHADRNLILSEATLGWGKASVADQNSGFHGNR